MARAMKGSGIEWIGEIPVEWQVPRIKNIIQQTKNGIKIGPFGSALTNKTTEKGEYNVYSQANLIASDFSFTKNTIDAYTFEELKGYEVFPGDICLSMMGTIGKCKKVPVGIARGIMDSHLIKIRLSESVDSRFFEYVYDKDLGGVCFSQMQFDKKGFIMDGLNTSIVKNLFFPLPSKYEQVRIADFLDSECARIDAVIEQTRASIEEYKKLKQSVITQAVTKGIHPGRKMKDSGIEWVGEIPDEWEVRRIKTLFRLRDEKNYLPLEEVNLISLYTDKGVVQHCDLEQTTGNKASNADGYKKVYENDIVVNIILCWMGAIGRSAYTGVTSPAYDIYVPSDEIECRYYHHYFRTKGFSGDCYKRGKGIMAMRWRTYSDQFRDIPVVMPPIEEQREILDYLDSKTAEIEKLIAKKEQLLAELESYKKSLIFEYVTGKKEVK